MEATVSVMLSIPGVRGLTLGQSPHPDHLLLSFLSPRTPGLQQGHRNLQDCDLAAG
jgi:hypothetical protein